MRQQFATPGPVVVRIRGAGGMVVVDTADTDTTEATVEALRDDDATNDALARLTVLHEERGGRHEVRVELPDVKGGFLRRGPRVAIRVRCPFGSDLDVRTSSADVTVTGRAGGVQVKSASGDVLLPVLDGALDAVTASGDIAVAEVGADASVKTASGDARIGRVTGGLSAGSVSGDISVGEARAGVELSTVSGDIELDTVRAGSVRLQSVSGDVSVGVPPGLGLWLDVASVSGATSSELDVQDVQDGPDVEEPGPRLELRVRTVSGDVVVRRAAPVPA